MKTINVIRHFGTKALVAEALRTSKQAIGQWGRNVPELRQYQLEIITNGALKSELTLTRIDKADENGMSKERQ